MTTYTFHAAGLHCNACILMTESELKDLPYIKEAKTSLEPNTIRVTGEFGDKDAATVAAELTVVLAKHGYALSVEKPSRERNWAEFSYAIPIAATFIVGFVALQKAGLVNLITTGDVSYGTAFVIGVIASLSTCMAVVGGLLLSMSATFVKGGDAVRPQVLFHAARIAAFFVLGGVIGALGSTFRLSGTATLVLGLILGVVMLILGLNLLDVFDWTKRFLPSMPRFIARHAQGVAKMNHALTPALVGIATFFLPCGFTQSMQLYALTTGTFLTGAFTMLAFALGTFPVLALISFGSSGMEKSAKRGIFFKSAGLVVIAFAAFNVVNGLAAAGVIPPVLIF